jgi:hypothetical protein
MAAAAVFDGGGAQLEALVAVAPADIAPAAERYRDTLAGWRALILPSATVDPGDYEARSEELRDEQAAARTELDAHLADCAPR